VTDTVYKITDVFYKLSDSSESLYITQSYFVKYIYTMHNKSFPKTAVTIREPLCEKKTIFVFLKSLGYYAKQFISQNGGNIDVTARS